MLRALRTVLFLITALLTMDAPLLRADEVVRDPVAGIEVIKPTSWSFLTAAQNLESFRQVPFKDRKIGEYAKKNARIPIIAFTKYPEPFDDVNLSLKINIQPAGSYSGKTGLDILERMLPLIQKNMIDFEVLAGPEDASIDGLPAGYAKLAYSMVFGGVSYDIVSELWTVPRGDFFFVIAAGHRADEKTGSGSELAAIVKTIKIDRE